MPHRRRSRQLGPRRRAAAAPVRVCGLGLGTPATECQSLTGGFRASVVKISARMASRDPQIFRRLLAAVVDDVECHLVAFAKVDAGLLDGRDMDEHVWAAAVL